MMPSTQSALKPSWANMFRIMMPYSSEVLVRLVEMRQYFTMSMPSKRAVLMLVLPMSRVSIMEASLRYLRFPPARPALVRAVPMAPVRMVEAAISARAFTPTKAHTNFNRFWPAIMP